MNRDEIKKNVEKLLELDAKCRESDEWLVYRYIRDIQGIKIFIPFEQFTRLVKFGSVTRVRRHLQNVENKYLPENPAVRRHRKISEDDWKRWVRKQGG